MNNLREIWGARFVHYITELQKYLKYVFTGHLAIVLVFTIGAGGYAYSEWLKEVPADFPAALLTAIITWGGTCLFTACHIIETSGYGLFLTTGTKTWTYMKRSLSWQLFSQLPLPFILYIVALPLTFCNRDRIEDGVYLALLFLSVILKWIFIETEYNFRHALGWRKGLARSGSPVFIGGIYAFIWTCWKSSYPSRLFGVSYRDV